MDKMEQVKYCGLCPARNRIPRQAGELRATMQKEGWDIWGRERAARRKTGFAYSDIRNRPYEVPDS